MPNKLRPVRISQCGVCSHKDRARIEMLRVGGVPLRVLSKQFSVSKNSVWRHFEKHVSPQRRAELTAGPAKVEQLANAAADESKSLLDYLGIARAVLFNQFLNAAEAGDRAGVANVAGRLLESLREIGRLTGEMREISGISITNNTLNIVGSPEFQALSEGLLAIARNSSVRPRGYRRIAARSGRQAGATEAERCDARRSVARGGGAPCFVSRFIRWMCPRSGASPSRCAISRKAGF